MEAENTKNEIMAHAGGRPALFETPESLENAIQAYFDTQTEKKLPITISGLAYALGFISRQSLYDYKEKEEFSYILKRATFFVESQYEAKLHGTTPTGPIFALKNMGWKDRTEIAPVDPDGNAIQPVININVIQPDKSAGL